MISRRYAPVGPLRVLEALDSIDHLGDYLLLLAHDVLADQSNWSGFIREWKHRNVGRTNKSDPYIIMDNSLIELGYPLSAKETAIAMDAVGADVYVLPDVLGDMEATIERVQVAYKTHQVPIGADCMAVVQGKTLDEVMECASALYDIAHPKAFAIPRVITDTVCSRQVVVDKLWMRYALPIHLLGFSHDLSDDVYAARMRGVMGIDSAMPIWYGLQGKRLPNIPPDGDNQIIGSRPKDYMWCSGVSELAVMNVQRVRKWLRH